MATYKRNSSTQTCNDLVTFSDSETQTGTTPYQATSSTRQHVGRSVIVGDRIIDPFRTPFVSDGFGWYEPGRSAQTSPMLGRASKKTQTPKKKNVEQMERGRKLNKKIRATKRQRMDNNECQGKILLHSHTHTIINIHIHTNKWIVKDNVIIKKIYFCGYF